MQDFVDTIERLKDKRFRTAAPFREDRLCAVGADIGAKELHNALGCILSIGVHHDYGVARGSLLNVRQADGDCPLVAKIAAQAQNSHRLHSGEAALKVAGVASLNRAIVD